ncbi:MAG: M16 family metallopeptidase [Hyphomicrobiales bacterium]
MNKINYHQKALLAFILLLPVCSFGQQINYTKHKLDNGLTVILSEDHSKPEVFGVVSVNAGGKNDPADATGMAHYQEHMLFKGTTELGTTDWEKEKVHIDKIFELYDKLGATKDEVKRAEIQKQINEESVEAGKYMILNETSKLIKQMGGTNLNAGTSWDRTAYFNVFPPNQIYRWIDLYSHRFINPVFRAFQSELETVYEEKNMYADDFFSCILEDVNSHIYKKHPYGQQTLIGTIEDLKNPSLTKMKKFFDDYYVANNMALVIIGDFNSEEILPAIKEKFGKLPSGEVPEFVAPKEEPFNGREYVEVRKSPVRLEILAFKSVPKGHPDEIYLDVFNSLLSNANQTGALDKLNIQGKVLQTMVTNDRKADYGAELVIVVPKLIGQKMEKAENYAIDAIQSICNGEFDESDLDAIRKQEYINFQLGLESSEYKALYFTAMFNQNRDLSEINSYLEKINNITKEEVIRVGKKYYGDNYLAYYSKMGFPSREKIEKPDYKPVSSNTGAESKYAKHFKAIDELNVQPQFVDFDNDIEELQVRDAVRLFKVHNKHNDIFNLKIKIGIGSTEMNKASFLAEVLNKAGTNKYSSVQLKQVFSKLGCKYSIYSTRDNFVIDIEGLEAALPEAIGIISDLLNQPDINEDNIDLVVSEIKAQRKLDSKEPATKAEILYTYAVYGDSSNYLTRPSKKELKRYKVEDFKKDLNKIRSYNFDFLYTGNTPVDEVKDVILKEFRFKKKLINSPELHRLKLKDYDENIIYFLHDKKAIQSNIYFYVPSTERNADDMTRIKAFNTYFGGGFSGLVLQEVREYRSLAYIAAAGFNQAYLPDRNDYLYGFVGTQADKTIEAITVFNDLLDNMPEKTERIDFIKPFVVQSAITAKPSFRQIGNSILKWKERGFKKDPSIDIYNQGKDLKFEDITDFYKEKVKGRPRVITIVGNKKKINMDELSKFGKVIKLKKKQVMNK